MSPNQSRQDPVVAELLAAAAILRHQANELIKAARDLEERAKEVERESHFRARKP